MLAASRVPRRQKASHRETPLLPPRDWQTRRRDGPLWDVDRRPPAAPAGRRVLEHAGYAAWSQHRGASRDDAGITRRLRPDKPSRLCQCSAAPLLRCSAGRSVGPDEDIRGASGAARPSMPRSSSVAPLQAGRRRRGSSAGGAALPASLAALSLVADGSLQPASRPRDDELSSCRAFGR